MINGRKDHPAWQVLKQYRYAHRGYHDKPQIPENSLPAFKRAIEHGWGAELDVHLLKDGTLAVCHDSNLKRCMGVEGDVEDLDREGLAALRLEGTDNHVPLFDEVLELFENATPLIIELKTHNGNHRALTEAVCQRLDSYKGDFCIESFDPFALKDLKELRPDICRGQLASDFMKDDDGLKLWQRIAATNLMFSPLNKPDFIAYKFADRNNKALRRLVKSGVQEFSWTIRNKTDMIICEASGSIPIFELFDPDEEVK